MRRSVIAITISLSGLGSSARPASPGALKFIPSSASSLATARGFSLNRRSCFPAPATIKSRPSTSHSQLREARGQGLNHNTEERIRRARQVRGTL
jgi:hypothetical protein